MEITHCTKGKNLQRKGDVKIGHQSCVYANAMHTELELCTPMGVEAVNRQLKLEAVLTAEQYYS